MRPAVHWRCLSRDLPRCRSRIQIRISAWNTTTARPPTLTRTGCPSAIATSTSTVPGLPIASPCTALNWRVFRSVFARRCLTRYAPSGPLALPVTGSSAMPISDSNSYFGLEHHDGAATHLDAHGLPVRNRDFHVDRAGPAHRLSLHRAELEGVSIRLRQTMLDQVCAQRSIGVACHGIFRDADRRGEHAAVSQGARRSRAQREHEVTIAFQDATQLGHARQIRLHRVEGVLATDADEDFRVSRRHDLDGTARIDVGAG